MCNNCRNPLYCIVPPIILDRIARNGNEGQRDRALRTLSRDHSLRMARLHMAELRVVIRRGAPTTGTLEQTCGNKRRTIYDAQNGETLPGVVVRPEGTDSAGDVAVDEAYDGLGATYDFFWETFERDSIDDDGMPLEATVHFGEDYDNAFWNGVQMVFGDGDGELFNRFTSSLDVIGHELAHGVTEDEAGLIYWREPGALNESMSDVFGSLVKQKKLGQTAEEADWLIGAELLGPEVDGVALRSMSAPGTAYDDDVLGKDPQPGTWTTSSTHSRTTAASTSIRGSRITPSIWLRRLSGVTPGNAQDASGTRLCATRSFARTLASEPSPALR